MIRRFRCAGSDCPEGGLKILATGNWTISSAEGCGYSIFLFDRRVTGRAVQLLLGHTKIESTVRYLGIEVDDALAIAEQVDV